MLREKIRFCFVASLLFFAGQIIGQTTNKSAWLTPPKYIQYAPSPNAFQIISNGKSAKIFVDPQDWKGVIRAAGDLGDDVRKVSGTASDVVQNTKFTKGGSKVRKGRFPKGLRPSTSLRTLHGSPGLRFGMTVSAKRGSVAFVRASRT